VFRLSYPARQPAGATAQAAENAERGQLDQQKTGDDSKREARGVVDRDQARRCVPDADEGGVPERDAES
jgi:hypothetical protein